MKDHYVANDEAEVKALEKGEYQVYTRRYFVAIALALGYAMWNWSGNRHVILAKSYAQYYNQPFEQQLFSSGDPGIDFLTIFGNAVLLFSYLPCAILVDKFGLRMMWIGNGMLAVGTWIWWFAGDNFAGAILGVGLGNVFGPLMSTSLLAVSNKWFSASERGSATAFVTIVSLLGAGLSVLGPSVLGIETTADKIDLTLKSCQATAATLNTSEVFCADFLQAQVEFCCAADADLPFYDLTLALLTTASAIFTVAAVRDRPPTPPSGGANAPNLPKIVPAFKHLFKWPTHQNFIFIMLSDFLVGGPPKVVFASIARILPASVAEYDVTATALSSVLVLPTAVIISRLLDRKKLYYPIVAGAFSFGVVTYYLMLICILAATPASDWAFLVFLVLGVCAVLAWQVGVFELKLEYVYTEKYSVEGLVLGTDRFVVNLSSAVFVTALSPESVGRDNVFIIGVVIMTLGLVPLFATKGKYAYERLAYEKRVGVDVSPERVLPIDFANTN